MYKRMLWIEVKTIEPERRVTIGIKHKMVEHDSTIHIERALDGIGTFGMATFPALAGSKDREGKKEEWKCFFQLTINNK